MAYYRMGRLILALGELEFQLDVFHFSLPRKGVCVWSERIRDKDRGRDYQCTISRHAPSLPLSPTTTNGCSVLGTRGFTKSWLLCWPPVVRVDVNEGTGDKQVRMMGGLGIPDGQICPVVREQHTFASSVGLVKL